MNTSQHQGIFIERKLYRRPDQGILKGVCAGLADYFNLPVRVVRFLAIISLFFGLFVFTIILYVALSMLLEPAPATSAEIYPQEDVNQTEQLLQQNEQRLRDLERYMTSDTFTTRASFRQL